MLPYERLQACVAAIRQKTDFAPRTALVLGSGLGGFGERLALEAAVDYKDIPGFPVSTVPGHQGRFLFGFVGEEPVVAMQGRVHYYEGYAMEDVVLPARLMRRMGAETLFLTNAAGSVNREFAAGDFMMLTDQISAFVPSPLIGPNEDKLGPRFCDMTTVYDKPLQAVIRACAKKLEIPLKEGVYMQLTGPEFETPATVRMCRILGADAVGMSTACEAVAANHMGMKICGISCISNLGAGMSDQPLSNEEVYETATRVAPMFKSLITAVIREIGGM